METLSQVSETVASNRLIKDVLQLLVTMTAQMMNSKICSIMLLDEASGELRICRRTQKPQRTVSPQSRTSRLGRVLVVVL